MSFFSRFPIISYDGAPAINIMSRVQFDQNTKNDPKNFISHQMTENLTRPDLIANAYYEDPEYDWLFYLSNDITDPYHEVYLNDDQFNAHMKQKYGSLYKARDYIAYYRNNWASSDAYTLGTTQYDGLAVSLQKYYSPKVNVYNNIVGYERKQADWIVATNQIRLLTVDDTSGATIGDIVIQTVSDVVIAKGEIVSRDDDTSTLCVKNITGTFANTANNVLTGRYTSISTRTVTDVINPSTEDNIPAGEASFWEAVTHYDDEYEKNQMKLNIRLIRKSQRGLIAQQLNTLLNT